MVNNCVAPACFSSIATRTAPTAVCIRLHNLASCSGKHEAEQLLRRCHRSQLHTAQRAARRKGGVVSTSYDGEEGESSHLVILIRPQKLGCVLPSLVLNSGVSIPATEDNSATDEHTNTHLRR